MIRRIKSIGIAVCLLLTAIPLNAQERRYELNEAKVAPGFYLAPNGYEYQLPQYGLTMTIPPQSYYKVPYLLKHNAYLVTNDSIVSYCLYKYYLSNSYTDFALFGSYSGNMRYRVAELKNNDRKEFLDDIQKKKKDVRNHRSLRSSFATFTHYSALNEAGEGRAHGYYYIANNILIEFIVIPRDDKELTACENIIKTLRKADLQNSLDDYLMMLSTLQTAVPGEGLDIEVKEEKEVEVLYAQELSTPTVVAQPASPFAEPVTKKANTEAAKNTSEMAAMLRASYGGKQAAAEEEKIEDIDVKIAEATELVVFKDGYIKPPEVEWIFSIQALPLHAYSAAAQQKPVRAIESRLLPIYPVVKRPDVQLAIVDVPRQNLTFTNNIKSVSSASSARIERSLLAIAPVVKRPDVYMDVDVQEQTILLANNTTKLNTSTTTAEKTLVSTITPVVKKPDLEIEVGNIESAAIPTTVTSKDFKVAKTDAEKNLLTITPVEKRPEVAIDIEVAEATIELGSGTSTSLNKSTGTAEKTLLSGITTVVRRPDVDVDDIEVSRVPIIFASRDLTASDTKAEQTLLTIKPVEKRPDVSFDVEVGNNTLPVDNVNPTISSSSGAVEKALLASVTPAAKQSEPNVVVNNTPAIQSTNSTAATLSTSSAQSSSVYVVTADIAEELLMKTQEEAEATMYSQPKVVNLLDPPVIEKRDEKRRAQISFEDAQYREVAPVRSRREVVSFGSGKETARVVAETATAQNTDSIKETAADKVQEASVLSNKRERCYHSVDEIMFAGVNEEIIPYSKVQQKPTFNGGDYNSFASWIGDHMCYPSGLRQELNGFVNVEITISSDGSIGKVNVMNSPHKLLENEVLYMLSTSPKWTPGVQNGKPVAVSVVVGVPFSVYL